jgi:hypothetical protein
MPIAKWKKESEESQKEQVFQEAFDLALEDIVAPVTVELPNGKVLEVPFPSDGIPTHQLEYIERTYRAIKDFASSDEIDYVLLETLDYYSDRRVHLNKRTYSETGHWYPNQKHRGGNKFKFSHRY